MTINQRIKQEGSEHECPEENPPQFFPADTDVKHDGNKTNYANQVPIKTGEEE